jgi:hypothetical protein
MSTKNVDTLRLILFLCAIMTFAAVMILPEKKLPVPLYPQPTDETCGEAAFLMAWNYMHPNKALEMNDVIATASQEGWYINPDPAGVFTSPAHMVDMATYYAGQQGEQSPETGQMTDSEQALMFLFSQVILGHPVVADVNTIMGDPESPAHYVVVTGVSLTQRVVYYNDPYGYIAPGSHQAAEKSADWTIFWNSWINNGDDNNKGNGWYMTVK